MTNKIVIGVDGGTTAVKAVAFDLDGSIRATHYESIPVCYGKCGEAEQDMEAIWQGVASCLRHVREACPDDDIVAVGLTGQGDGAWLVDNNGQPVGPAATWLDGRAAERVNTWENDGRSAEVLATSGTTIFGGLFPVLYEEFRENDPERISKAAQHLYCKDWLRYRLTGEYLTDYTEASRTFLDVSTMKYSTTMAEKLGIPEALDLLPDIRPADAPGGVVSPEAEKETGIPAGTPVGIGMIDVAVTGAGLSAVDDGEGWLILGTTGFVGTLLPNAQARRSQVSMVLATGRGSQVLEFLVPMTGTPNLDWIRDVVGFSNLSWGEIEEKARTAPAGSGGVIYLPYASPGGERAPFLDTNASASWMGMSLTTPTSHVLRAVYEGVAFSLVECIKTLKLDGDLVVSGGGFRSSLVCEILADATGQRVVRQEAPEAGARGAAVLALVSAGQANDVKEASNMLKTGMEEFLPNPENYDMYQRTHDVFVAARKAIQPVWPAMRKLRHESEA
ncbi:carbohydrate kinase [Arcanobacterium haemolyticum]|nr:carbohydrate kinase [Arcanobacterium haemolyticum]